MGSIDFSTISLFKPGTLKLFMDKEEKMAMALLGRPAAPWQKYEISGYSVISITITPHAS